MGASFFYKLFLSTIGSMPAQYDPEVDSWWGIILTELGLLDPFREGNLSYLLVKFLSTVMFALLLWALSICNAYKDTRKQQDDVREDSMNGASEFCDLKNKFRDMQDELYYANEKLQDAEKDMDDERKGFRDIIQELDDQHLVDKEKTRSLKQDLSNTECDREEYGRRFDYASRENQKLARENQKLAREKQKLEREHQQLEASLAEKDTTIKDFQIDRNDTHAVFVAAVLPPPIYIRSNHTALELATTDGDVNDARCLENEGPGDAQAKPSEDLKKQVAAKDRELALRESRVKDLEQQNGTLTSEISGARTDLASLRGEHGKCSGHLRMQLAEKDEELKILEARKGTADEESAEAVAALQRKLSEKEQEIADLEEANGTLVAGAATSTDTIQRLNELGNELELSRQAHAQCVKESTSQSSKIDELVTAKEQLDETLQAKQDEIASLQGRVRLSEKNSEDLRETHARCGEHANAQALKIRELRNANEFLQGTNGGLWQQLGTARDNLANLTEEHQRVQKLLVSLRQAGSDLLLTHRGEVQLLQVQIGTLDQTVENQQQSIQALESNCPTCQKLREALDEVLNDVEMSDDQTRAEMKKEITVEVRAELRSQVVDDLRRRIRNDMEHQVGEEFRKHYSDLLASNTRRIKEQDRLLSEMDVKLEEAKNGPNVNHAACEKKETNLKSAVNKLQQDARIAKQIHSRLSGEVKHYRQQFENAQPATENLRSELEKIKADQRRAQNVNPLQSKLTRCQRDLENMKVDRDKARFNSGEYSRQLSILKNQHKALEHEHRVFKEKSSLDGDSIMDDGRTEEPIAVQNEQRTAASAADKSTVSTLQNEVARFSKELEERKGRDNFQNQAVLDLGALPGNHPFRVDGGEQQWPARSFRDHQKSAALAMDGDEAAALDLLRHEVDIRDARDGKTKTICTGPTLEGSGGSKCKKWTQGSDGEAIDERSWPSNGGEESNDEVEEKRVLHTKLASKSASKPLHKFRRRRPHQSMTKQVLGRGAGTKREHDGHSDGEADDERWDDRKKVKISVLEDGISRLNRLGDYSAPAQGDKMQQEKDIQ